MTEQNATIMKDHEKEVAVLKQSLSVMESRKIEKVWVKNINKSGT